MSQKNDMKNALLEKKFPDARADELATKLVNAGYYDPNLLPDIPEEQFTTCGFLPGEILACRKRGNSIL